MLGRFLFGVRAFFFANVNPQRVAVYSAWCAYLFQASVLFEINLVVSKVMVQGPGHGVSSGVLAMEVRELDPNLWRPRTCDLHDGHFPSGQSFELLHAMHVPCRPLART